MGQLAEFVQFLGCEGGCPSVCGVVIDKRPQGRSFEEAVEVVRRVVFSKSRRLSQCPSPEVCEAIVEAIAREEWLMIEVDAPLSPNISLLLTRLTEDLRADRLLECSAGASPTQVLLYVQGHNFETYLATKAPRDLLTNPMATISREEDVL